MKTEFSFHLDQIFGKENQLECLRKIACEYYEFSILIPKDELLKIPEVINANWNERTSLKLGKCLGSPTWWSFEDERLSILVGIDDECWQFGIIIPNPYVKDLINQINSYKSNAK